MAGSKNEGLKRQAIKALAEEMDIPLHLIDPDAPAPPPVQVSGEATKVLSDKMRQWSGWKNSRLVFGPPAGGSPFASCDHITRTFTANPEALVLNPNRVLLSVTPFRLRQEAVLTGCLLHEAGHARHSHWRPRTEEQLKKFKHSDGSPVKKQTVALANLMEEARIEGLQARDASSIGAAGLDWTMRASAAHLLPTTELSMDPNQRLMDLLSSWALRAGRQIALNHFTGHVTRPWVQQFTTLLTDQITEHLRRLSDGDVDDDPEADARRVINNLLAMVRNKDDTGPTAVDHARYVLEILFPETDGDDEGAPMPSGGCSLSVPQGDGQSDDEESEGEASEGGQGEDDESESDGEGESTGEGDEQSEDEGEFPSPLAEALEEMESEAEADAKETEQQEKGKPPTNPGGGSGAGTGDLPKGPGWRAPTKDEREFQRGAEKFLRDLIDQTEGSTVSLTDTPSSTVDGAALSAWKAGGQIRAPHFFQRTRREVEPSPPVKIAILVDVSGSMGVLQKPSSILSWALASAALDLRNFAGRGQQVESCLIHWGHEVEVIQHNGKQMPGIYEAPCLQMTTAMGEALNEVENEIPGFFSAGERPENRLLVQFTDWQFRSSEGDLVSTRISEALAAGVNMVTVAPQGYSPRMSALTDVLRRCPIQRGSNALMRYNPMFPEQVWEAAATALR